MTAADQPTTEPSVVERAAETLDRAWSEYRQAADAWIEDKNPQMWDDPPTPPTSFDLAQVLADAGLLAPAPQPAADTALRDRLAEVLGDDVYVVGRVWEAWSHGTMTADDFTLATETDVLDDLVAAAAPPAADTEWSWLRPGHRMVGLSEGDARSRAAEHGGIVQRRTVFTAPEPTPWEEA